MTKKKPDELNQEIAELTADLQRLRADFENYRKRTDEEKQAARTYGEMNMVAKLLPVLDDIERATAHVPAELADNAWAGGVVNLAKNLDRTLADIGVTRIVADAGSDFNPDQHHAVQFDENSDGEREIIAEELQSGYMLSGQVLRPAMVRVSRA
jgi:molecular chaperone GrpE